MKKAIKFGKLISETLTKEENKIIANAINTICDNHKNESWAKMYCVITTTVTRTLSQIHADEMLAELNEQEVED